jgi:hypothetical protein
MGLFCRVAKRVTETRFLSMADPQEQIRKSWWSDKESKWATLRGQREEQVFLVLTLLIGALVGLSPELQGGGD